MEEEEDIRFLWIKQALLLLEGAEIQLLLARSVALNAARAEFANS